MPALPRSSKTYLLIIGRFANLFCASTRVERWHKYQQQRATPLPQRNVGLKPFARTPHDPGPAQKRIFQRHLGGVCSDSCSRFLLSERYYEVWPTFMLVTKRITKLLQNPAHLIFWLRQYIVCGGA